MSYSPPIRRSRRIGPRGRAIPAPAPRRTAPRPQPDLLRRALRLGHRPDRLGLRPVAGLAGRRPEDILHRWTGTEAAPPENLPPYQRSLLVWARDHVLPDLDVRAPGAYVAARRRLWYSHRREVLGFLARGAGLDPGAGGRLDAAVEGLDDDDRARFSVWLLGSGREALKLKLLRGLAQGRIFGYWRSLGTALGESSVLPWSAKIAFMEADAPEADSISNLPEAAHVLDHWQITARAYTETMVALRQAQWERAAAGDEKIASRSYARSRELWRSGGPDHVRSFLADTRRTGREVRTAQETLLGLATADQNAGGEGAEEAVRGSVAKAATTLARARSVVGDLSGTADRLGTGIGDRMAELSDLYRQDLSAPAAPWWERASRSLGEALGRFSDQLRNPDNWKLALEVGLEIAGTVATGGAALAARVAKWLVDTGLAVKDKLKTVQQALGQLRSRDGLLAIFPFQRLFSLVPVEKLAVEALFGRIRSPAADGGPEEAPKEKKPAKRPGGGFAGAAAALAARLTRLHGRVRDSVVSLLSRLDLSDEPWFRRFVHAYSRAVRVGGATSNLVARGRTWIHQARGGLKKHAGEMKKRAVKLVRVLQKPDRVIDRFSDKLTAAGVGYLVHRLLTHPPSASLKVALRAASGILDATPETMTAWIRQHVPMAGSILASIETTVAEPVKMLVQKPAGDAIAFAATQVKDTALPAVDQAAGAFQGGLDRLEARVDTLAHRPSLEVEPSPGSLTENGKTVQRQPEEVHILLHHNALYWQRRQDVLEKAFGFGRSEAPDERRLDLGAATVEVAQRVIRARWGAPRPSLPDTRLQVNWGSFEIFGRLDQVWTFVEQVGRVFEGRTAIPQGASLVPGEPSSTDQLQDAIAGRSRTTFFDLRGGVAEVRSAVLRWLIAHRALQHWAHDRERIIWQLVATTDFDQVYAPGNRQPKTAKDANQCRAWLKERKPESLPALQDTRVDLPVLLLCYQFVLHLSMRLGGTSTREVDNTFESLYDQEGWAKGSKSALFYPVLGAAGPNHLVHYLRPGSGIVRHPEFPKLPRPRTPGFAEGKRPKVGAPLFVWECPGGVPKITHVCLCVGPDLYVGLDSDQFQLETAREILDRYGDDLHGLTFAPPLV